MHKLFQNIIRDITITSTELAIQTLNYTETTSLAFVSTIDQQIFRRIRSYTHDN